MDAFLRVLLTVLFAWFYFFEQRACWGRTPRHAEAVRVMLNNGVPHDLASRNGNTCDEMTRNELTHAVIQEAIVASGAASAEL